MTRALLTGAAGMLGRDVLPQLAGLPGVEVEAVGRDRLDVTDAGAVEEAVRGTGVVVNCAAWTAVDDAETREAEAFAVNAIGAANLARACARAGSWLLHVSTDYVFAGDAAEPYPEGAPVAPRTAYGRTKVAGEWAVRAELPGRHWILRTGWLYGAHGTNFVRTMLGLEASRPTVDVVDDQRGQPTWTVDLAARIAAVVRDRPPAGVYHATASGQVSWHGFAQEVFGLVGAQASRVRPVSSAQFVRPAPRPAWSVLGHGGWAAAGLAPMRDWREALAEAMPSMR